VASRADQAVAADPGEVLCGRYRLVEPVGRGGVGEVWAADDLRLDRRVAVKLLRPELTGDPAVRLRFESEARAAARLNHPNVVSVFDAGEHDGRALLVMELLDGKTLADEIGRGPLGAEAARSMAVQVLAALEAAHAQGLVHRDVKPGNILRSADGGWKVGDFGIAKSVAEAGDLTATGLLVGTPAYLAPERVDGRPATGASDIFSLGAVLFEAVTGVKPFAGDTPLAIAAAVRADDPPPIRSLRPDVPEGLAASVDRALAKDPADRFPTAGAMAAALGAPVAGDAAATQALATGAAVAGTTQVMAAVPAPPAAAAGPRRTRLLPAYRLPRPWADPEDERRRPGLRTWLAALVAVIVIVLLAATAGHHRAPASTRATTTTTVADTVPTTLATTTTLAPPPPHHGHHGDHSGPGAAPAPGPGPGGDG